MDRRVRESVRWEEERRRTRKGGQKAGKHDATKKDEQKTVADGERRKWVNVLKVKETES
ncbi:hypothetical protein K0M31_013802 [Melipona bicolor]|uniref:Uncharacterized protein n=1 Tax=Melipona bicolor TaxID=60889 RepID=A0AA40FHL2_9HYME|nr:hypothetical protein K0M31_013802 [Melipona bicolor]